MSLVGIRTLTDSDLRDVTSTKTTQLGAVGATEDGRLFRYAGAGASAINAGQLAIAAAKVANHENISLASTSQTAVGSKIITVTLGATAATQDQYAEGTLVINDGAGAGAAYRISGNTAGASSGTVVVSLAEPIATALSTSTTKVTLVANDYAAVITSTTAGLPIGIPQVTIPANNYGWVQRSGISAPLAQGAVTKGNGIVQSTTTAGAITTEAAGTLTLRVGIAAEALVDTKYYRANLTLE